MFLNHTTILSKGFISLKGGYTAPMLDLQTNEGRRIFLTFLAFFALMTIGTIGFKLVGIWT
jgi:hypothetical protein